MLKDEYVTTENLGLRVRDGFSLRHQTDPMEDEGRKDFPRPF